MSPHQRKLLLRLPCRYRFMETNSLLLKLMVPFQLHKSCKSQGWDNYEDEFESLQKEEVVASFKMFSVFLWWTWGKPRNNITQENVTSLRQDSNLETCQIKSKNTKHSTALQINRCNISRSPLCSHALHTLFIPIRPALVATAFALLWVSFVTSQNW